MPGSPLACLDALAGETVEAACEKALFGSPASVASASAYVGAQLTLLASTVALARHEGVALESLLAPLRRSLESDRFGFVAHVLAIRDGCTAQNCKTLALFRDAKRVRTNLTTSTLERYLEHYAAVWSAGSEVPPLADATQTPASPTGSTGQGTRKIVNIDFPSAASIPAVSIMNPEPTGPVLPGVAAAAAANPNPSAAGSAAPRHTRRQSPNPNATITGQSTQSAVEPIWPEPVPPPAGAAPPAASAPAAGSAGPVQLIPPPPNASGGAGARTQSARRKPRCPLIHQPCSIPFLLPIAARLLAALPALPTARDRTIAVYSGRGCACVAPACLRRGLFIGPAEPRESYLSSNG